MWPVITKILTVIIHRDTLHNISHHNRISFAPVPSLFAHAVEQSSQLKAQLATVEADLTDSRQQLTAQEIALRQLHADFAQCQQQRIVALVGQAVQHRNQHSELDTVDRQHRQLRERIAERQRLLQSYEQQKEELQAQMQDLKRQQHIKDGTVEVLAVEVLPELSSPEVDHPAAATIATATNNVEDFCLEAELDQMNISGELQAGVVDASLPQQQPAVQIARQVHGARIEARRVSFNPTEKVRAIAANGEESPSQLDRSEADYEMPSKQLLQTNDIADDGVQNDPAVAIQSPEVAAVAETETVQFEDMNDSFMCALADAVVVPISSGPVVAVPPPPVDERAKATVADGLTDRLDGNDDDDDDSFMCALVNSDSMSARIDQPTEQPQKTSDVAAHNESFMRGLDDGDRISAPQRADESIEEVENEEPNRRNASLLDESLSAAFFEEDTSVMMDRDGGVADFDLFGTNTVAGADGSNNGAPPEKRRRLDDAPINALNASSFRSGDFEFEFNGFDGDAAAAAAADAPTGGTEETDADATLNRSRANSLFNFDGDFAYNHQDDAALF